MNGSEFRTKTSDQNTFIFRYDPYSKVFSREYYDHDLMKKNRKEAIEKAATCDTWGLILGTLGRQGHPPVLKHIQQKAEDRGKKVITVLLSEIFPHKLSLMSDVGAWVQVACPRYVQTLSKTRL